MGEAVAIGTRRWRFHGGLKLRHWKTLSLERTLATCPLPERLVVPVGQQRSGAPVPCVRPGQLVARGEAIALPSSPDDVALHAPAAGTVRQIAPAPVIGRGATEAPCITIDVDPDGPDAFLSPITAWATTAPAALRTRIREAGVAGLGGALFPTAGKIDAAGESAPTLIVNGAECEPYIACDEAQMLAGPERVLLGAQIIARAVGAAQVILAIEDERPELAERLAESAASLGDAAPAIVTVPTVYPEGGEKQLIRVLTGLEVPGGGTPLDLGLLCLNVGTVAAVHDAVVEGRPLISRVVSVTGRGFGAPRNLEVAIGTPVAWLAAQAGGYTDAIRRLVMGGPMMGVPLAHDDVPVTRASNCILGLIAEDITPTAPELPCIRCMECVRVCPAQLLPQQLFWHIRAGSYDQAANHALADCIECGCCAQVCPSQIPLVDYYRHGKTELAAQRVEQERATVARLRFEARSARLDRQEAARRERLEAKQQKLRSARDRKAEIAAAVARARARKQGNDEDL